MFFDETLCDFDQKTSRLFFQSPWDQDTTFCLTPWEDGCRLLVRERENWRDTPNDLDFPLFDEHVLLCPAHPVSLFAQGLPKDELSALARYEVDQLAMLRVCAATPRGGQLLHCASNVLWFAAPEILRVSAGDVAIIHQVLGNPLKKLLREILCVPDMVALKILLRTDPPRLVDDARKRLLRVLSNKEQCDIVRHKHAINWSLLCLMEKFFTLSQLVPVRRILLQSDGYTQLADELSDLCAISEDCLRMGRVLGIADAQRCLARCRSVKEVYTLHDNWTTRMHEQTIREKIEYMSQPFPEPPLQGTKDIHPICNGWQLYLEGKTMHNCIVSYLPEVHKGHVYMYRMMHPQRASIEVRRTPTGQWALAQIKGYCNSSVQAESRIAAQQWLQGCNGQDIMGRIH